VALGCAPLTSGAGFNTRWFSFAILSAAPPGAAVGAAFQLTPDAISAVHPRLATPGGLTLLTSSANGFWTGGDPPTGRFLPVDGLPPGTYMLGFEKLDSPLHSLTTPPFHAVVYLP
jgi:hypothetical protein